MWEEKSESEARGKTNSKSQTISKSKYQMFQTPVWLYFFCLLLFEFWLFEFVWDLEFFKL
jgi:hypothetical protein